MIHRDDVPGHGTGHWLKPLQTTYYRNASDSVRIDQTHDTVQLKPQCG